MSIPFPDTVFVLCTGRCGSTTLARACAHLSNWTVAHESRTHLLGEARFAVPPRHIEVDNRLAWMLGRLDRAWGDRAAYVHLSRDPAEVAASYAARAHQGLAKAWREGILVRHLRRPPVPPLIDACRDMIETIEANIDHFLRDKTHVLSMRLETLEEDFETFAGWIGAEGDLESARAEIRVRHNPTEPER